MRNMGILLSVHKLNEKPSRWSMMTVLKKAPDNYASRGRGGVGWGKLTGCLDLES